RDKPDLFSVPPQIDSSGKLTFVPKPNVEGTTTVTVTLQDDGGTTSGGVDTSLPQTFTITVTKPHRWNNTIRTLDVDNNGQVAPLDALHVIHYLTAAFPTAVPATALIGDPEFLDTDANDEVAPLDALLVINGLNAGLGGEGEP